jgi:predicted transcriptional regulator
MATVTATTAERITIIDENLQWGYARLPRPVLKARGLSERAKCIYTLLLDYAWQQESCFPGQETMACDLDMSVDTIQRGLQELRDYGLIDWKRQGFNRTNTYYILRLSECEKLRMVQPEQAQEKPRPDTANLRTQSPQNGGMQKPQSCGSKKTKSKQTQESDEDSSRKAQKEKDEVEATCSQMEHGALRKAETSTPTPLEQTTPDPCPSASRNPASPTHTDPSTPHHTGGAAKHEALAFGRKTRRPGQSFGKTQQQQEKPPVLLERPLKPLTQDEIDEKKRQGLNASGYTPLPGLIPPDQWQQLEQQARNAPVKPQATHFNVCTKNAPLFIDTTIEQFTSLLGDDQANTAQNINRAAKLYRETGLTEEAYREALYAALDQAKRSCSANIQKKRADGRPNRMPVFFAILQARLAA